MNFWKRHSICQSYNSRDFQILSLWMKHVVDVVTKWINVSTDDNSDSRDYRGWLLYPSPWATITPQESGNSTTLSTGNTYSFSFDWSHCKLPGISLLRFFWRIRDGEMAQMAFKYYILFLIMCSNFCCFGIRNVKVEFYEAIIS